MRKSRVKETTTFVSFSDSVEDATDARVFHHFSTTWAVDCCADLRLNPFAGESTESVETLWWCSWRNFSNTFGGACSDDEG